MNRIMSVQEIEEARAAVREVKAAIQELYNELDCGWWMEAYHSGSEINVRKYIEAELGKLQEWQRDLEWRERSAWGLRPTGA